MLTRRTVMHLRVLAGHLFVISLGGWLLSPPTAVHAQADSSRSLQRPAARPTAPAAAGTPAVRELFRQYCVKCHGADGTGSLARSLLPETPDFTAASWQARRSEAQLLASILDGKGTGMPPARGKISEEQARGLVGYVRAFAPTTGKSRPNESEGPGSFDERYRRLEKQLEELRKQFRKLSEDATGGAPSKPPESRHRKVTQPSVPAAVEVAQPSVPAPAGRRAVRELFRLHCVKCHGVDGTGTPARCRVPEIPNFTDASWQARRSEAQLLASILDGKGTEMPPERGKISEEQARGLVAYVRAFAPTAEKSRQKEQEGVAPTLPWSGQEKQQRPARGEPAEPKPPRGFSRKLIRWLGKFHPPAVHFPIALLTAAAVAELLRMATGMAAFNAASRYCVCFGAITAVVAGGLGWFMGGFGLTDASWVLMMHRWLRTSTVVCAGLVLMLSEVGRRPDRPRTQMCFRVTLFAVAVLVLVTGFFGGAVVFGLDHYSWPE